MVILKVLDIGEKLTVKGMFDNIRNYMVLSVASVGVLIVTRLFFGQERVQEIVLSEYEVPISLFMQSFVVGLLLLNVMQSLVMYSRIYYALKEWIANGNTDRNFAVKFIAWLALLPTYIVSVTLGLLAITAGTAAAVLEGSNKALQVILRLLQAAGAG